MPRVSFIYSLPKNVRNELMEWLVDNGFSHHDGLVVWLKNLDYDVSKSALHRFAQQLESDPGEIRSQVLGEAYQAQSAAIDPRVTMIDLRMRCVEASAISNVGDVLVAAQSYLDWIIQD